MIRRSSSRLAFEVGVEQVEVRAAHFYTAPRRGLEGDGTVTPVAGLSRTGEIGSLSSSAPVGRSCAPPCAESFLREVPP